MTTVERITPCLWFDDEAESAARFYVGIFPRSRITAASYYGEAGQEIHGRAPGSAMVVAFELDGRSFTALNGGPVFKFNEAISLQVNCATQEEIDHYWQRLGQDGDAEAQQCGWLKDRYGVSWQVVPDRMAEFMTAADPRKSERVMAAVLQMKKLDIAELERAFAG